MIIIQLTQGQVTFIDDEDFERVSKYKWYAAKHGKRFYVYGMRSKLRLHRFIMNCPKGMQVDHIDGNTLNNQKYNLRVCTKTQNSYNRFKSTKFPYKGIRQYYNGRWGARIRVNKKEFYLGTFDSMEEAAEAYNKAAKEHFKEFAKLNLLKE